MNRPFHDIVEQAVAAAPLWDLAAVGIDVPQELFEALVAEGMDAWGRTNALITRPCGGTAAVFGIDYDEGIPPRVTVHCHFQDVSIYSLTAHQRLTLAAARAKQEVAT